ncbi:PLASMODESMATA CALLOSE-BINDING PROTEIN 3-like [Quillaja saponaria]|uniref:PLASMODESMATA CALLOSE-BINDING PROTEIN 3-like n=1 Tax=Quillaja saponaria TaxID=32244 RepID=A0AAD7VM65_QUISA|nr:PLASMODESMATA CALLOSE-BINDING PROTEIN 3-like [Quillaja saponaria]
MAAPPPSPFSKLVSLMTILAISMLGILGNENVILGVEGASWCVARSDASTPALQTALDYACASGADCTPIQSSGLCYLPNTIQAHASYAFNSYFQRKAMAPGSCDFSGTATIAQTDPSYGSCVFPSSSSAAGGTGTPTPTTNPPNVPSPPTNIPIFGGGGAGGLTPGMTPTIPENSRALGEALITAFLIPLSFFVLSLTFQPM